MKVIEVYGSRYNTNREYICPLGGGAVNTPGDLVVRGAETLATFNSNCSQLDLEKIVCRTTGQKCQNR